MKINEFISEEGGRYWNLVEAGVGKIVKGVNTTVDVQPGETQRQAAKFGNKVDSQGRPPEIHRKARKNSDPNTLYNLGLAEDDIRTAHQLITNLDVEDHQLEAKSAVIIHLELALDNLPGSPILTAENLELAWQLLKNGLPDSSFTEESVTITPDSGNAQVTPTNTPTLTVTPTPNP